MQLIFGFSWSASLETRDEEYHQVYDNMLKPLIREFYQVPTLYFTFYVSGIVLQWLSRTHSEAIDVLAEMVKRKQAEVLGGSFYEPFVMHVPTFDYMRQIELFSDNIRKLFAKRPQGFLLPAGIWHPQVVPLLAKSGIAYTFIPVSVIDSMSHHTSYRPCITEYDGKTLALFPLTVRPSQGFFPHHCEEYLEKMHQAPVEGGVGTIILPLSSMGINKPDDVQRWLEVLHPRHSMTLTLPWQTYRKTESFTKVHPSASDCEHLFTPHSTLHGHSLRSLLRVFPEVAKIYEKMYHTHTIIQQFRGDKARKNSARMNLWRGQSHFVYWNGFTTGVQSPALRQLHYSSLIEAEKTVRQKGSFFPALTQTDYDFDGFPETLFYGNNINAYIHHVGASVFEFDWLHRNWNYGNSYTRRENHLPPMQNVLPAYDRYPRHSFVDLCLAPGQSITKFAQLEYEESGILRDQRYEVVHFDRQKKMVAFQCVANMKDGSKIVVKKGYNFVNNGFTVTYDISLSGQEGLFHMDFCPDIVLAFADIARLQVFCKGEEIVTDKPIEISSCPELYINDEYNCSAITLSFSHAGPLWSIPAYAWCYHRGSLKKQYQFSSFVPVCPVRIEGTRSFHCAIKVLVERSVNSIPGKKE